MTTHGDQILDRALSKVGGKGLFVKELETALEDGRAQLAVHSLKDVPMELPPGFVLAAVLEREDPRDAWVSARHASPAELPQGAVVGTSSLRRVVQLLALRPDLHIEPLRGNLDTRLRKLDEGGYDAIVLAAAGLMRLGLGSASACVSQPRPMLPAAGQGALGIEVREDAAALRETLAQLVHLPTLLAVEAEREVSRGLGGSCSMPLAAHAIWAGDQLMLSAALGDADEPTRPLLRVSLESPAQRRPRRARWARSAVRALRASGRRGYLPRAPDVAVPARCAVAGACSSPGRSRRPQRLGCGAAGAGYRRRGPAADRDRPAGRHGAAAPRPGGIGAAGAGVLRQRQCGRALLRAAARRHRLACRHAGRGTRAGHGGGAARARRAASQRRRAGPQAPSFDSEAAVGAVAGPRLAWPLGARRAR